MRREVVPSVCPACGGVDVKPIVYGYPGSEMLNDPTIALGGCVIYEDSPAFVCGTCAATWDQGGIR